MTDRKPQPIRLVALAGSLRAGSTNRALLDAANILAPTGVTISLADPGALPHFNSDLEGEQLPMEAAAWRSKVAECDGMVVSCPEYAGGIPGTFKNALDWLVPEPRLYRKPVAIISASQRSVLAQDALRVVLRTMSADVVEQASATLDLLGSKAGAEEIARDEAMSRKIAETLRALVAYIRARG